ncbi:MAG: serine hydrolase [Myxococcales bacterium]|nr:serine hydrolase [Myxococcales bacterium]
MRKWTLGTILVLLVVAGGAAILYRQEFSRLAFATSLFSGAEQYETFGRIAELFPTARMRAPRRAISFPRGAPTSLPETFLYRGKQLSVPEFLEATDTSALLVLQDGRVRFEDYWLTGGRDVPWLSMSVAKSFISALVGLAVEEGRISSIEEPITTYLPALEGSAYDGVRIKDILQMSSGAAWDETYGDPDSDINRFARILAIGGSLNEFSTTLAREREPGTFNQYNSTDTQVLGWLLVRTTGQPIAAYMEEKLWVPLGMENDAFWMIDSDGMEMAFGGLNATARDYAKLGELYRNDGRFQGEEILPAHWVRASVTPDAPHLLPGDHELSDWEIGYGYQWWVPESNEGEFAAIGVYNQFIYVNPTRDVVIVKLSANSAYATEPDGSADQEFETIEFFRAIGSQLAPIAP